MFQSFDIIKADISQIYRNAIPLQICRTRYQCPQSTRGAKLKIKIQELCAAIFDDLTQWNTMIGHEHSLVSLKSEFSRKIA